LSPRSANRLHRALLLLLLPGLLCACQPRPQSPAGVTGDATTVTPWPAVDYATAAVHGARLLLLDAKATQIDIVVRRDGPLARFGHDHVVTVVDPEGLLLEDATGIARRADLRFRPERLDVDSPAARERHQLDTTPDAADIEGTRENLMNHVLDSTRWPWATLELTEFEWQQDHYSAMVTVGLNGSSYSSRQPFRFREEGERAIVDGFLLLRQTDLGIEPFSALGGGLRVADPLEIHFHIEANRH
jgi:hypothetical protein